MGSEVSSSNQSKTVNFDHSKEFQECMDTYEISKGVESFEKIALAIAFYESSYNIHLTVMKSSALHYWQYSCKQHSEFCVLLVNTLVLGCCIRKNVYSYTVVLLWK